MKFGKRTASLMITGLCLTGLAYVQMSCQNKSKTETAETTAAADSAKTTAEAGDFPLQTLDGKTTNLSALKGKVVFMNVWATWCPPCRAELPDIEKLYKKMQGKPVEFVMLTVDEDLQAARDFMKKEGFSFPVYAPTGDLPKQFETQAIPVTFLIDADGKIVYRNEGMANYNSDEFVEQVMTLLPK